MLSTKFKFICFAVVLVSAAAVLFVYPNLKGELAPVSVDDVQQGLERPGKVRVVFEAKKRLATVISTCGLANKLVENPVKAPFSPAANLCLSGNSLALADPVYNRPQTQSTGNGFGPASVCTLSGSANAVHYDTFGFNLTGCAAFPTVVTMTLCGPAGCVAPTDLDAVMTLYRNVPAGDPLTANGGLPGVFNPASPCTNARALQDDDSGTSAASGGSSCNQLLTTDCLTCATFAGTSLPGMKRSLGNGRFTLVITGFGNSTVGNYNLYVDAPSAGCTVALAPTSGEGSIGGRVTTSTGQGIPNATLTVTGSEIAPMTLRTNGFGYYNFPNIPSGSTYIVTVSSKMYTFANPSQTVTLDESASSVDFVSEQ